MRLAEAGTTPGSSPAASPVVPEERYDLLLLAGTPQRVSCMLPGDIAAGAEIDAEGGHWTVADVRRSGTETPRLICIYAD